MKNKNRFIRRICFLLACLLVLAQYPGMTIAASAPGQTGSIRLNFPKGIDLSGVGMAVYRVADCTQDQSFVSSGVFADCGIDFMHLKDAEETQQKAEQLWQLASAGGAEKLQCVIRSDGLLCMVGTDGSLYPAELTPACYLLVQSDSRDRVEIQKLLVPVPYQTENAGLSYDVALTPKCEVPEGAALLTKVDDSRNVLPKAKFDLYRKVYVSRDGEVPEGAELGQDGGGRFLWEKYKTALEADKNGQIALKHLPLGTYRFIETQAPEGYVLDATPHYFSVDAGGTIRQENGIYKADSDKVALVEAVNEKETETESEPEPGEDTPGLLVTKRLSDQQGYTLMAGDSEFYVALFEDEARTKRATGVKKIHFSGTVSETVQFRGLDPKKTYYLGETDADGNFLTSTLVKGVVCAPEYTGGYAGKPTVEDQTELSLTNVFHDLPDGFYYGGELTVTKRTLRGGQAYDTDEVFYAALFTNPELTQRYGEVIELPMGGGSETSVTIPISIGTDVNGSMTYYVAETDENGRVLDGSDTLGFTVTVDQASLTFSTQNSEQTVVITNDFEEEQTESESRRQTETGAQIETGGQTPGSGGGSTSSGGGTNVRTGDETPLALYLVLLAVSAAAVAFILWSRKRK